jgi:hypothetical protein
MPGADVTMEAESGGRFEYGGRFRGQFSIWRQIPGAVFNMEADLFFTGQFCFARKNKTCYSVSSFFNKGRST